MRKFSRYFCVRCECEWRSLIKAPMAKDVLKPISGAATEQRTENARLPSYRYFPTHRCSPAVSLLPLAPDAKYHMSTVAFSVTVLSCLNEAKWGHYEHFLYVTDTDAWMTKSHHFNRQMKTAMYFMSKRGLNGWILRTFSNHITCCIRSVKYIHWYSY